MESLFLYCRLCNRLKKIALQDEWSARIVKELFEQYFQLEDKLFLYMSFILVILFEQKQLKITVTHSENCWQISGLSTPEYAKKKGGMKYESVLPVRLTERLGHALDLWNNANNFLTIKLEVHVIFSKTLYVCFFPKPCSTRLSVPQLQVLCSWKYVWRKTRWLANNIFS